MGDTQIVPCLTNLCMDRYKDRLFEWCTARIRSKEAYELLRQLFAYDPDKRLTAREAMEHKWFQEEPLPTKKYVRHSSLEGLAYIYLMQRFPDAHWRATASPTTDYSRGSLYFNAAHKCKRGGGTSSSASSILSTYQRRSQFS